MMGWVLVGTSAADTATRDAVVEQANAVPFFKPYNKNIQRGEFIGDRARPGPIFNYARVFIWIRRAESLINRYQQPIHPNGTLNTHWRRTSRMHVLYSLVLALTLQWTVSSASIILTYLTPTVGLSCRSGGFLIYTVNSTIVLFSLMFGSFLSDLSFSADSAGRLPKAYAFGCAAVVLRSLGKAIAVLNAAWICIHCIFEFTLFYENCWCNSNFAVLGQKGYWIWLPEAQLRELWNIKEIWSGSTALATIVPGLYVLFFLVTHSHYYQR